MKPARAIHVLQGSGTPLIVLLHGFAGSADDLAPFAKSLGVAGHFVFPEAGLTLEAYDLPGRAWWPSDGSRGDGVRPRGGGARDLSDFEPEALDTAREHFSDFLDELQAEHGGELVLGGFSQGAMLAFDVALRTPRAIKALVQFSGCRIARRRWDPRLTARAGMRAFVSHGRFDDDLSFEATEAFVTDLVAAGWNIDFCPFDGGHEMPLPVLRRLKAFLRSL